jgi:hypothetical protein
MIIYLFVVYLMKTPGLFLLNLAKGEKKQQS